MSGLEVIGLVAGIVSAFAGVGTFLSDRKKRKEDKKARQQEAAALQQSVAIGPPQVQGEYDSDFLRIGPRFASGDDIARNALSQILINMQQKMIATLQAALMSRSPEFNINYSALLGVSDRSRMDAVSSLAQQYQRFSIAAPIARGIAESGPNWCPGAIKLQQDDTLLVKSWSWKCPDCKRVMVPWNPKSNNPPSFTRGCSGMHYAFSQKQHTKGKEILNQCTICWEKLGVVSRAMNCRDWLLHVSKHFAEDGFEMCRDSGGEQQRRSACKTALCGKIHAGVQ